MKVILAALLCAAVAPAHDLQENRATLVLRDRTHLSVTIFLNYSEALFQALAPQREFGAFLAIFASMKPEDLQRELTRAQTKFQSGIHIAISGGKELTLTNWVWPNAKQVQASLQQQVMQAMVDGHVHESPLEIRADAVAPQEITSVTVRFPEEFQKVLVVSYRPNQIWVDPQKLFPEIRF